MNYAKLQMESIKALASQSYAVAYTTYAGMVFFTNDGYSAFGIPNEMCFLNLSKARRLDRLKDYFAIDSKKDKLVKKTKIQLQDSRGVILKLKAENDFSVYVRRFLFEKFFDGHTLYCAGPTEPVKMVNDVTNQVEALVLPIRHYDSEEE